MAVLITGGAGYIGSHTAAELIDAGEETVIIDNLQKGHKDAVLGGKLYIGDLRDDEFLDKVFRENDIMEVIHFAADSLVGESMENPLKYYDNNVISTINLMKKMKQYNVKRIVFSSTAAVYGEPKSVPITEEHITNPTNTYGETKLAVEKAMQWVDKAYGIKFISLRYFNASGAHPNGLIGEDHRPESHLIPLILKAALSKNPVINVFGDDYDTPDGTCIRDYIHVMDLAQAHILALKKIRNNGKSSIYNLGNGKGFSVNEVIEIAREVTGVNIKAELTNRRSGDPAVLIASSDKAREELNWIPKYDDLKTIIATAWEWHKNHPNGFGK